MNSLIRNISGCLLRPNKHLFMSLNKFATDSKQIEALTKKNKVVVFMKVFLFGYNNLLFQSILLHV